MAVIDIINEFRSTEGWTNDTFLWIFADFVAESNLEHELRKYCVLRADGEEEYEYMKQVTVYVGHVHRKYVVNSAQREEILSANYPSHQAFGGPNKNDMREVPLIRVGEDDFFEVLFELNDFKGPLKNTLKKLGNPTEFVLEDVGEEALLFIDTQGYSYPRYKASADII